jgi:SAM-dependent methyltransferase
MEGYALPPVCNSSRVSFKINDQPFDDVEYPIERADLGERFWHRANAAHSGFKCRARRQGSYLFRNGSISLQCCYPGRPGRFWFHDAWFLRDPRLQGEFPSPELRQRVIGSEDLDSFCYGGFTDFTRIKLLLAHLFGKNFDDFKRILDWGCGCGRLARYFENERGISVTGADVDPDAVSWCAENLKFGHFQTIPLHPPTEFAKGSFDLIYGMSVFTHLREQAQYEWLEELRRIAAPEAVLLMTTHGTTALNYGGAPAGPFQELMEKIQREGFVITSGNDQINEVLDEKGYYINVMHSKPYICLNWGQYFEVLDIIPGFIYTHDMVVMRRGAD